MAVRAQALRLAEVAATRLCHDLSGPIGSLNQALELATMDLSVQSEAFALARKAAAELSHRIRLLRAAWGADGQGLDLPGLRSLAAGLRVDLDLSGMPVNAALSPSMARVLLNVLLLANESLPRGGRIALSGGPKDTFATIEGPNAAWPAGLPLCLADEDAAMAAISDPRTLQMPLTVLLAHGLGLHLSALLGGPAGLPFPLRISEP